MRAVFQEVIDVIETDGKQIICNNDYSNLWIIDKLLNC